MKKVTFAFIFILLITNSFAQSIFEKDNKFGVRNLNGETVLPAVFHQILNIDYGRFLLVQVEYENLGEKKSPSHSFNQEVNLQFWNSNRNMNFEGSNLAERQFPFLPNLKYGIFEAGKLDSIVVPCEFSAIISEWNPDGDMSAKTSNYLYFVRDSSKYSLLGNEAIGITSDSTRQNKVKSNSIQFSDFQLDPQGYWLKIIANKKHLVLKHDSVNLDSASIKTVGDSMSWQFFNKSLQLQSDLSYSEVKFLQSIVTDNSGNLLDRRPNNVAMKFQTGSIYLVGDSTGNYFFNSVKKTNFPNQAFKSYSETKVGWLIELQNGKFGIADSNYQFWLIEPEYDKLEHKKRKIYSFEKDGNSGELEIE